MKLMMTFFVLGLLTFYLASDVLANSTNQTGLRTKDALSSQSETCLTEWNRCRDIPKCKKLFKKVQRKCTSSGHKCELDERTTLQCAKRIEMLLLKSFSNNCDCPFTRKTPLKNLQQCANIYNLIHSNPCYDAGIFLRQKEEDKKALKTTSTPETVPETAPAPLRKEDTQSSISYKDSEDSLNVLHNINNSTTENITNPEDTDEYEYEEITEEDLENLDRYLAPDIIYRAHKISPSSSQVFSSTLQTPDAKTPKNLPKSLVNPISEKQATSSGQPAELVRTKKVQDYLIPGVGLGLGIVMFMLAATTIIYFVYKKNRKVKYTRGNGVENPL